MTKHIIVIGGGPGGIEAACTVAANGGRATIITDSSLGGRAGWDSLLPSKVWLTAADRLGEIDAARTLGLSATANAVDTADVLARLKAVEESWNSAQQAALEELGVEIITGVASFVGPQTVEVVGGDVHAQHTADAIIVATGSVPWLPEGLKPDGRRVIVPRFISHLEQLPRRLVVIGGGPTGCEFAYLFNRLGVAVTWVVDYYGVLPNFHPDAGALLAESLRAQGVELLAERAASHIDRSESGVVVHLDDGHTLEADMAFVAIGRRPDWGRLNLSAAGIDPTDGRVTVDAFGRCTNPAVYLVGDADGGLMHANKAMAQGRVAALHALGLPVEPFNPDNVLLATYTDPQAAQVGQVEGLDVITRRVSYNAALKPSLTGETAGFVEISYRQEDGRLSGGLAVGPHAADVLAPVAVALQLKATIDQLAGIYVAHPTLSELVFLAARS
ncbi:putative Dihydrolipoyl dehydrogenase [Candidatus Promineifilum breve]|uniref:Dihydrolipoyl dehydrogenase n=1 Tax=Candidatus Promineifilum breve TaxID=1806508 RepID=A0A160SZ48_9CHLR|nr:NAD(P)/FAD-dependent oxidoreductase [Candidatus Promineifilum breve]CUS02292.2 putative Dihydrolipoyl dehydrogenase [Candidatus Promineifilum breve]